jgi:hypothetical protein
MTFIFISTTVACSSYNRAVRDGAVRGKEFSRLIKILEILMLDISSHVFWDEGILIKSIASGHTSASQTE